MPSGSLLLFVCDSDLRRDIQVFLHNELLESRPAFLRPGHFPMSPYVVSWIAVDLFVDDRGFGFVGSLPNFQVA